MRFAEDEFRISTFSGGDAGTCVEVAVRSDMVGVRHSKAPDAGTLAFTPAEWEAFVEGVKAGEFDVA